MVEAMPAIAARPAIGSGARAGDAAAVAVLLAAALALFLTAPADGDFWWSDAPRHALNGVFVRDFLAQLPIGDPVGYATDYYLRYPALSILFYPPLMSLIMAGFYAAFGASHAVAQASIAALYGMLGIGTYCLAREWLTRASALGAALMLMGAPEIAFWGRQVMLDIPAYAWLALAAWALVRHLRTRAPGLLYASVGLLAMGLYTKQTLVFALPVWAIVLLQARGWRSLMRDRHVWTAGAALALLLVPLAYFTVQFGQVNVASLAGSIRPDIPRWSIAAWTFYAELLPSQLGWLTVACAPGYVASAGIRGGWRLPRQAALLLLCWLAIGYAFFSLIMVREPRHDLMALLPVAIAAAALFDRLASLAGRAAPIVRGAAVAAGLLTLASALQAPVPFVTGYAEAARDVAGRTQDGDVVMFSGERDGNFIFDARVLAPHRSLSIIRSDKLLLRLAIERSRGVEDRGLSAAEILDLIDRYGVRYVVAQTGFWTDLPSMRRLDDVLRSDRFEEVRRIAVTSNAPHGDRELVILRNRAPVTTMPRPIELEMVGIGRTLRGTLGASPTPPRD